MSHKEEAVQWLNAAVSDQVRESPVGAAASASMTARANVLAILALVEAQEAANEQARIGNLIAFWQMEGGPYKAVNQVTTTTGHAQVEILNAIIKALGIEVAE